MTPLVSIIIPTYNYGNFIDSAIRSALAQQEYPCEVIVVDDGSTDNTVEVIQPYLESIRYIRQDNAGLSAARNTGIKSSRGSYLQFLDADDLLGKGVVAAKVTIMEKYPSIGLVVCRNQFFCTEPVRWWSSLFCGAWRLYPENLDVHLCFSNIAPPHAYLIRRDLALSIGEFDTGLLACEDYDYWLRSAFAGYVPIFSPNGKVYYRRHAVSMSANRIRQTQWDAVMHIRLYNLLNEYPNFPERSRLLGLMAFLAGTLQTIARLYDYSIPVHDDLYRICAAVSKKIKTESTKDSINKNSVFYFYLLLIDEKLNSLKNNRLFANKIRVYLFNALINMQLPTKSSSIAWKALKISLFEKETSYLQRYKLVKTTIRFLVFRGFLWKSKFYAS